MTRDVGYGGSKSLDLGPLVSSLVRCVYVGIVNSNVTSSVLGNKTISPPWAISRAFT